jgi:hypothetical protein
MSHALDDQRIVDLWKHPVRRFAFHTILHFSVGKDGSG